MVLRGFSSSFPGSWSGFGLLLLRLAVGLTSVAQGAGNLIATSDPTFETRLIGIVATVTGASILIGLLTPIASIAAALVSMVAPEAFPLIAGNLFGARLGSINTVVMAVALALLGPGAFSVDAYLFGRREIIIPDTSHSEEH
jgi:uncharacterized membrane protein YphA (DoxX/SURF4 family)